MIVTGMWQGCILSQILFAVAIKWVMEHATIHIKGISWITENGMLEDFDIDDDIALFGSSEKEVEELKTGCKLSLAYISRQRKCRS